MIYGIGIDILKIDRIDLTLSKRILGEEERRIYESLKREERKREFLAGRFAAKEAFMKALKVGISKFPLRDIQVIHNKEFGNPEILVNEKIKRHLDDLGISASHISITHEKDYVVVVVVLEK